jgi:hypothetical protein
MYMKSVKCLLMLPAGLALVCSGCASINPPAENRADWKQQQKQQQEVANSSIYKNDPSFYWFLWLAGIGATLGRGLSEQPSWDNGQGGPAYQNNFQTSYDGRNR